MAQFEYSTGGGKAQSYFQRLKQQYGGNNPVLKVGFLENATYPDGTPVAMIAMIQEFGATNIPPRPFFRTMIAQNQSSWAPQITVLIKQGMKPEDALDTMGQVIAGQLRASIIAMNSPPNAPSTIARKGSAKPLVETGHMLNSVDFEVETK